MRPGDDREHRRSESRRPAVRTRKTTAGTAVRVPRAGREGWEDDREHRRSEFRWPGMKLGTTTARTAGQRFGGQGRRPRAPQVRAPEARREGEEYDREHRRSEFRWDGGRERSPRQAAGGPGGRRGTVAVIGHRGGGGPPAPTGTLACRECRCKLLCLHACRCKLLCLQGHNAAGDTASARPRGRESWESDRKLRA